MHDAKNCLVERYVPHGMDIFEMFADLSYAGVLAVLVAVNTAPILMPPTWIILFMPPIRPSILYILHWWELLVPPRDVLYYKESADNFESLYKENKNQTWITSRVILEKKNSDMHWPRFFLLQRRFQATWLFDASSHNGLGGSSNIQ